MLRLCADSRPIPGFRASKRGTDNRIPIRAVRFAAIVLTPSCFIRILMKQVTTDPMMLADLGAAQS
jgi:hypothetical protein